MTPASDLSRADNTRARLLTAAVTAFAAKGYHATTTRDIAAAAGMSPAALYIHHKSKEELLYLIAVTGNRAVLSALRACAARSDDPVTQLHEMVHSLAVNHARDHTMAAVINSQLEALTPEHFAEIRAIRRETTAEVLSVIERGVAVGVFDTPDPKMATTALLSLSMDIARWYRDEGRWTPEEIGDRYAEMALRMLGATRPAADLLRSEMWSAGSGDAG
ncbi:TetR/AcrR family transcriptional regulator [Actinoplanes sp. NPDC049681]|uniref:TetR/AcrR family transcriptional regulator n=1 Tax=Actinoplanes sp. NPDC049681 TaxID=3363905 RepID=UPI003795A224